MQQRVSRMYGYKSVVIRDQNNKYLMEMYLPIRLEKGQEKIQQMEKRIKASKQGKEFRTEGPDSKPQNKLMKAIFVEEFETDESMHDIDFEYLVSDSAYSEESHSLDDRMIMDDPALDMASQQRKLQTKKKQKEMMKKLEKYR